MLAPAIFGPKSASIDASRNYDRMFETAYKARPELLQAALSEGRVSAVVAVLQKWIDEQYHSIIFAVFSITDSTKCPGIGKAAAQGRGRHRCTPVCRRWWAGNGGDLMIGFHGNTPLPSINGIQDLLDAMRKSTELLKEQWRNQVDICGCHLGIDDFDEKCKPRIPNALPKTTAEILTILVQKPLVHTATNRLRNGRDKTSASEWREQRIVREAEAQLHEANRAIVAAEEQTASANAYAEELEARVASLELGLESAITAASSTTREAELLQARTLHLQEMCRDQEDSNAELRAEVAAINATFDAYKRGLESEVGSPGAAGKLWVDLRRAYIQHFGGDIGVDDFGLDAVKKICYLAGRPKEFMRVAAAAAPIRHNCKLSCDTEKGSARQMSLQRAKEQRVAALWLLTLEGTSQRLHVVQDVAAVLSPISTGAGAHFSGATGCARPSRSADRERAKGRATYDQKLAAAVNAAISEECERGKSRVLVLWDDDYTRIWMTQIYHNLEGRAKVHMWTTVAIWAIESTAPAPTVDPAIPIFNPHGFSGSSINWIISVAHPGFETHREWLARSIGFDISAGFDGSSGDYLSASSVRNRCQQLAYNMAAEAEVQRNLKGMFLVDLMDMQFKSYQEMCRTLLRQACLPVTCQKLLSGHYIESTGDWPKAQLQRVIIMQAYPNDKCAVRGIRHLGELLYAACHKCRNGNAPANMGLWKRWMQTCGASNLDDGIKLAGTAVSRIIPVGPGALHRHLNPLTDLLKWHREWFFSPFYRAVESMELPLKLKAKEVALWCELALSGWEIVRQDMMPMIKKVQEATPGGRFDITAALHLFEHSMPMACYDYDLFTRLDIRGNQTSCPEGDDYLNRQVIACQSVENVVRGRENYGPACARLIDDSLYRERAGHSWAAYEKVTRAATQEDKGECGMHCSLRNACQRYIDSEAAIAQAKRHIGVLTGIDPISAAAAATLGKKRRLRLATVSKIEERSRLAAIFVRDLWLAMLQAPPERQPNRVSPSGMKTTGPPSDWFHVPSWPGSPTVLASEVGGFGHALFSAKMGNRYFAADHCAASATGCQMPRCPEASNAVAMACGHKACRECSRSQHCQRCIVPLTARYLYILRYCRKVDLEKLLTVKRLKMSACYWRKRKVPTAVYIAAHTLVTNCTTEEEEPYQLYTEPSDAVELDGDLGDGEFWSGFNGEDSGPGSDLEDEEGQAALDDGVEVTEDGVIRSSPPSYKKIRRVPLREDILCSIHADTFVPPATVISLSQTLQDRLKVLTEMTRDAGLSKAGKAAAAKEKKAKLRVGPIGSAYKIPRNPNAPQSPPQAPADVDPHDVGEETGKSEQRSTARTRRLLGTRARKYTGRGRGVGRVGGKRREK